MANDEYGSGPSTIDNDYRPKEEIPGSKTRIQEQAAKVQEQATKYGQKAVEAIDAQRQTAASGLANVASGLHAKADDLPGGGTISGLAHQTADKLNATAGYLRDHDMSDIGSDVERFVKTHPVQALIGAAVVGFLAGRAARS